VPLLEEGRTLRGIGEPIWAGRSDDELAECAWHESLINTAFSGAAGFSILCPYDTALLDSDVIDEARGTHPHVGPPEAIEASPHYRVDDRSCPEAVLSPVPEGVEWVAFDGDGHVELRRRVRGAAMAAGLSVDTADDAVLAVNEAVVNTVIHAGGSGRLRTWTDGCAFLCEIRDWGRIDDPLAGRRRPSTDQAGGRGLWLIHQLCDLVQVRRVGGEQAIRIRISPARPPIG
jgi:anti-sigma regulatory factor (Ser/Thr protein kinase)